MSGLAALPLEAAAALAGLLGCMIGSFLNVVAHRLPGIVLAEAGGERPALGLAFPASHCPHCDTPLTWRENVPLVSWLLQRGRCRHCSSAISYRYPLLEALGGLAAAACVCRFGFTVEAGLAAAFLLALLALAAIDIEAGLLPDRITLPLLWVGLIAAASSFGPTPAQAILGAAAGYGLLDGLNRLSRLCLGRDGMGGGDAKLAAAMGAWLGPIGLVWALLLAFTAGAAYGVAARKAASADPTGEELPFGPWLALGAAVLTIWPELVAIGGRWLTSGSF